MRLIHYIFFIVFISLSCKKKKEQIIKYKPLSYFYEYDISPVIQKKLSPKKKQKVPFEYNLIYDPFLKNNSPEALTKSTYWYKAGGTPEVKLMKKKESIVNIAKRGKKPDFRKAYPILIENNHEKDTLYLKLFRGKMLIMQESFHEKKDKWIAMEYFAKEKMGYYYYKIYPKEYIYTKVPIYEGKAKKELRIKVIINDSTTQYLPTFEGSIPWEISK